MNTDTQSTSAIEKSKYLNHMDEALENNLQSYFSRSPFYISSCKTPNEAWTILEGLFGKHDEMRGHMLEVELLVLVVEPDYLPDSEVFYFQPCLYPMKYLHPRSMYTLPRGGVQRGGTPSAGSGGLSRG
jgi:hypothetical protein